jgi:hypothetical protein
VTIIFIYQDASEGQEEITDCARKSIRESGYGAILLSHMSGHGAIRMLMIS